MSEVFFIVIIYLIARLTLDCMQIYTVKTVSVDKEAAHLLGINSSDELKSREYNIAKLKISILKNVIYVGLLIYFLFGGLINNMNVLMLELFSSEYLVNLSIILMTYIIIHLSLLPLSFITTFVIEEKYGFNTTSKKLFFRDNVISTVMSLALICLVSSIFFYIISFESVWWFLMASTIFIIIIVSVYIYPSYISPLFNKFDNLEDENIKSEIQDLSNQTNFSIKNLYIMDKSKRTKHPNAYFTGFKNNRRIVFYDTLIELLSPKEIKAVLAHEIGHYKHNHIIKSMIMSVIIIFVGMYLLSYLVNSDHYLLLLNLPINESSKFIALIFSYQIMSFFIEPFFSIISRKNEYEADNFASSKVNREYLITSLIKLYKSNLSFVIPNKFYAMFYFSHPTVLERINNLRRNDDRT